MATERADGDKAFFGVVLALETLTVEPFLDETDWALQDSSFGLHYATFHLLARVCEALFIADHRLLMFVCSALGLCRR